VNEACHGPIRADDKYTRPGAAQPGDDGDPVTGPGESKSEPERDSAGQEQTQAPTETS